MSMKELVTALVTSLIAGLVGLVFNSVTTLTLLLNELWQRLFVGIWFVWLGAAVFGLFWLVRFLNNMHRSITETVPTSIQAQKELIEKGLLAKTQPLEILHTSSELSLQKEARSRVAANDTLSLRLNAIEAALKNDLNREVGSLHTKLDELLRKEAHERTDGVNAINHRLDVDLERMNKLETSVPQQVLLRIKEIQAQISALNKRVEKVEPLLGLNLETYQDMIIPPSRRTGILNSSPGVPTTPEELMPGLLSRANPITPVPNQEILAQELLDHKNKNKKAT